MIASYIIKIGILFLSCIALLGVTTGCAAKWRTSYIKSTYARTQNLPAKAEPKTFAFDTDSVKRGTFEYENFCNKIASVLTAYGWRRVDATNRPPSEKPDCWVTVACGYAQDSVNDAGRFRRTAAPSLVRDNNASDFYSRILAYYAAINITTEPLGEGDNLFLAQIFGSTDTEMIIALPVMFDQLLKDFPGENVPSKDVMLRTR